MRSIGVCIASHNRKLKTIACLQALFACDLPAEMQLAVYLLDDGSTDGTREAVNLLFPRVELLLGDGSCYWSGGMRAAFGAALAASHDYYLWLNDDVTISPQGLRSLLEEHATLTIKYGDRDHVVVGAVLDSSSGKISYSGLRHPHRLTPWRLVRVEPALNQPLQCDTINGNLVLIPRTVAGRIGNIHTTYTHAYGDLDYGFQARRAGVLIWVAREPMGYCDVNTARPRWNAAGLSLRSRWRMINSPLGLPVKDQFTYAVRNFGVGSLGVAIAPYAGMIAAHCRAFISSRGR